jgi:hypothetical protein
MIDKSGILKLENALLGQHIEVMEGAEHGYKRIPKHVTYPCKCRIMMGNSYCHNLTSQDCVTWACPFWDT